MNKIFNLNPEFVDRNTRFNCKPSKDQAPNFFSAKNLILASSKKCFLKGICKGGHLLHVDKTDDLAGCMAKCKNSQNCKHITFNQEFKICQLFATCSKTDALACPKCMNQLSHK